MKRHRGTERFTLSELLQGVGGGGLQFLGGGTTKSVVTEHFTAETITFCGKETAGIQYKQQKGPFGFLIHITNQ